MRYRVGREVAIVEPVVRVQRRIAVIPISATVIFIRAALRHEFDLDRSFSRTLCTRSRSRYGNFADGVGAGTNIHKETIVGFQQVVLHVDAVESDVQRAFGQPINCRRAWAAGGCCARQCQHQVERVARCRRDVGNLTSGERRADGRSLGLKQFTAANNRNHLALVANF